LLKIFPLPKGTAKYNRETALVSASLPTTIDEFALKHTTSRLR